MATTHPCQPVLYLGHGFPEQVSGIVEAVPVVSRPSAQPSLNPEPRPNRGLAPGGPELGSHLLPV